MVPGVRRDGAWMPAFAGMTNYDTVSLQRGEFLPLVKGGGKEFSSDALYNYRIFSNKDSIFMKKEPLAKVS